MSGFLYDIIPVVAILSAVALPILFGGCVIVVALRARHKERMAAIERGLSPQIDIPTSSPNSYRSLRNGCLCIGIALGLIIGFFFAEVLGYHAPENFLIVGFSTLLFLGLAYVIFFFIMNKKEEEQEKKND